MLLHLYLYFQKFRENGDWFNRYYELEFIEDEIMLGDPDVSQFEDIKLKDRVKKYNYRKVEHVFLKNIGFKVKDVRSEGFSIETIKTKSISFDDMIGREFEVRPQYYATIDGIEYRLDIAVILSRKTPDGKIIESKKVALECDGYDYHSSPEQKRNDDIRTRKLKKSGWKEVLRYSGKELHSLKSKNEIHLLFEEIVDILYT